jgi:hypothetical protein
MYGKPNQIRSNNHSTKALIFGIFLAISTYSISQKKLDLTISLDKEIDASKIECSYYDGKNDYPVLIADTFINGTLKLKNVFYSDFASFHIDYRINNSTSFYNDFFVNEHPAKIHFNFNANNPNNKLEYKEALSATPIFDTAANEMFKKLTNYRLKEAEELSQLWEKHGGEIKSNDSIALLNQKLFKSLNIRTVSFIKDHSSNYFSFWYFRTQVVETSLAFLTKDTYYLKSLLDSLNSIFPEKYIKSYEGQSMINRLTGVVKPVIPGILTPPVQNN